MPEEPLLEKIEATLTFTDGETCQILLAEDADSAWGNVDRVLWRSVPVREAILDTLRDNELLGEAVEEESVEPIVPGNAEYLTWVTDLGTRWFAKRVGELWRTENNDLYRLEELPGLSTAAEITVLDKRES